MYSGRLKYTIKKIFKRGLPKAVPINMHLGFEGIIFGKILTP
jgi:hypothetical protein